MSLGVVPVMGDFVGEVSGIDLARPLDPRALATIIDAIDRFGVLVFRAQAIDDDALEAFGRQLGPLFNAGTEFGMDFSVIRLGNLDDNNHIHTENDHYRAMNLANAFWHVDNSFSEPPAKYSVLMARIVPPSGGETEFADARAAYDALPGAIKAKIEGLSCAHSFVYSRSLTGFTEFSEEQRRALPDRIHPIVQRNPRTDRRALYVTSHICRVLGLAEEEGRTLIRDLTEFASQASFVYRHQWSPGDVLMYDNEAVLHRALPFPDLEFPRDMRAIRVMRA